MIRKKNYWLFSIVLLAAAESTYGNCCPCGKDNNAELMIDDKNSKNFISTPTTVVSSNHNNANSHNEGNKLFDYENNNKVNSLVVSNSNNIQKVVITNDNKDDTSNNTEGKGDNHSDVNSTLYFKNIDKKELHRKVNIKNNSIINEHLYDKNRDSVAFLEQVHDQNNGDDILSVTSGQDGYEIKYLNGNNFLNSAKKTWMNGDQKISKTMNTSHVKSITKGLKNNTQNSNNLYKKGHKNNTRNSNNLYGGNSKMDPNNKYFMSLNKFDQRNYVRNKHNYGYIYNNTHKKW